MKFTPEMFQPYLPSIESINVLYAQMCADAAQYAFDKWLEGQLVVLGRPVPTGEHMRWSAYKFPETSHTARLVDIREIKK